MEDLISDKLEDSNQNQLFFIYIAPMNLSDFMKNSYAVLSSKDISLFVYFL